MSLIRRAANRVLKSAGYQITKVDPPPLDLRCLTKDPIEGLYRANGRPFLVDIPLNRCRSLGPLAFRCVPGSGHPLIAAIELYLANKANSGHISLISFYQRWTPRSAAEILGLSNSDASSELRTIPPYGCALPWVNATPPEYARFTQQVHRRENLSWGLDAGVDEGTILFGPMSHRKAQVETMRLMSVTNSLIKMGDLSGKQGHGYISGYLLISGNDWVISIIHGQHRIAALAAIGHTSTTLLLGTGRDPWPQFAVRRNEAAFWPNVKNGIFNVKQALEIFDRIFEGKQPPGADPFLELQNSNLVNSTSPQTR